MPCLHARADCIVQCNYQSQHVSWQMKPYQQYKGMSFDFLVYSKRQTLDLIHELNDFLDYVTRSTLDLQVYFSQILPDYANT